MENLSPAVAWFLCIQLICLVNTQTTHQVSTGVASSLTIQSSFHQLTASTNDIRQTTPLTIAVEQSSTVLTHTPMSSETSSENLERSTIDGVSSAIVNSDTTKYATSSEHSTVMNDISVFNSIASGSVIHTDSGISEGDSLLLRTSQYYNSQTPPVTLTHQTTTTQISDPESAKTVSATTVSSAIKMNQPKTTNLFMNEVESTITSSNNIQTLLSSNPLSFRSADIQTISPNVENSASKSSTFTGNILSESESYFNLGSVLSSDSLITTTETNQHIASTGISQSTSTLLEKTNTVIGTTSYLLSESASITIQSDNSKVETSLSMKTSLMTDQSFPALSSSYTSNSEISFSKANILSTMSSSNFIVSSSEAEIMSSVNPSFESLSTMVVESYSSVTASVTNSPSFHSSTTAVLKTIETSKESVQVNTNTNIAMITTPILSTNFEVSSSIKVISSSIASESRSNVISIYTSDQTAVLATQITQTLNLFTSVASLASGGFASLTSDTVSFTSSKTNPLSVLGSTLQSVSTEMMTSTGALSNGTPAVSSTIISEDISSTSGQEISTKLFPISTSLVGSVTQSQLLKESSTSVLSSSNLDSNLATSFLLSTVEHSASSSGSISPTMSDGQSQSNTPNSLVAISPTSSSSAASMVFPTDSLGATKDSVSETVSSMQSADFTISPSWTGVESQTSLQTLSHTTSPMIISSGGIISSLYSTHTVTESAASDMSSLISSDSNSYSVFPSKSLSASSQMGSSTLLLGTSTRDIISADLESASITSTVSHSFELSSHVSESMISSQTGFSSIRTSNDITSSYDTTPMLSAMTPSNMISETKNISDSSLSMKTSSDVLSIPTETSVSSMEISALVTSTPKSETSAFMPQSSDMETPAIVSSVYSTETPTETQSFSLTSMIVASTPRIETFTMLTSTSSMDTPSVVTSTSDRETQSFLTLSSNIGVSTILDSASSMQSPVLVTLTPSIETPTVSIMETVAGMTSVSSIETPVTMTSVSSQEVWTVVTSASSMGTLSTITIPVTILPTPSSSFSVGESSNHTIQTQTVQESYSTFILKSSLSSMQSLLTSIYHETLLTLSEFLTTKPFSETTSFPQINRSSAYSNSFSSSDFVSLISNTLNSESARETVQSFSSLVTNTIYPVYTSGMQSSQYLSSLITSESRIESVVFSSTSNTSELTPMPTSEILSSFSSVLTTDAQALTTSLNSIFVSSDSLSSRLPIVTLSSDSLISMTMISSSVISHVDTNSSIMQSPTLSAELTMYTSFSSTFESTSALTPSSVFSSMTPTTAVVSSSAPKISTMSLTTESQVSPVFTSSLRDFSSAATETKLFSTSPSLTFSTSITSSQQASATISVQPSTTSTQLSSAVSMETSKISSSVVLESGSFSDSSRSSALLPSFSVQSSTAISSVPLSSATVGIYSSPVSSSASISTSAQTSHSVVSSIEASSVMSVFMSSSLSVPIEMQSSILPSSPTRDLPTQLSTSTAVVQTASSSVLALVSDNSTLLQSMTPTVEISPSATLSVTESVFTVSSAAMTTDFSNGTSATISTVPATSAVPVTTPVPTTTQQPTTTENVVATYWIAIVLKVPMNVDVSLNSEFANTTEVNLAELYGEAYKRQEDIASGNFSPLRRRKRRYTTPDGYTAEIHNITRTANTGNVTVGYTVQKNGTLVPASQATSTLGLLSDQEMAIKLGYVVAKKPSSYVGADSVVPVVPDESPNNLWIVGVAVGGIVLIIIVIWVVFCCIVKSKRAPPDDEKQGQPTLYKMKEKGDTERESMGTVGEGASGHKVKSSKRQSYEVTSENDGLYTEVKRPKSGKHAREGSSAGESVTMETEDVDLLPSPKKGKKKKKKPGDEKIEKAHHTKSGNMSHPIPEIGQYSAEEEEELHNRREAERKKNKQRIREKRKREKAKKDDIGDDDTIRQYLAVQEEIDQVLDAPPPEGEIPDVFKTKSRKRSKKKGDKDGEVNDGFEEEPITEAKKRMHKLLDDAFALISPTLSGAENDDSGSNCDARSTGSKSPIARLKDRNKIFPQENGMTPTYLTTWEQLHPDKPEKIHEPMYINPSYMSNEGPGLTTWSPYRASDQVALISMPKTMQTSLGNGDGGKSGRRPVASLTENVPKSKMTTDPPKPIILRTRELIKDGKEVRKAGQNFVDSSKPYLNNGFGSHGEGTIDNLKSSHIGGKDKKSGKKSASGVEMKTLNGDLLANRVSQKHQAPNKRTPLGEDVTDVVSKSIHAGQTPEQTVRSVRNELQGMTNTDAGTAVLNPSASRKGRPPSGALVDIA